MFCKLLTRLKVTIHQFVRIISKLFIHEQYLEGPQILLCESFYENKEGCHFSSGGGTGHVYRCMKTEE